MARFSNISHNVEWVPVRLSQLLFEHGQKSSGAEQVHSVSVSKGLINQVEHLGRSFAAANTDHYNLVLPGDVVYTKSPTGEFPLGIVKRSNLQHDAIVSPLYGVFTPVSDEIGVLIDQLFSDPNFSLRYLSPLVFKGAKNTINVTNAQFLSGMIPVPKIDDHLHAIVDFIQTSRREVELVSQQLRALKKRNDGIMKSFLSTKGAGGQSEPA